jgi:hypothetical protein
MSVPINDLNDLRLYLTTNETDLRKSDGSQDDLSHPITVQLSTDIYTAFQISLLSLTVRKLPLLNLPPNDPGNDQSRLDQ